MAIKLDYIHQHPRATIFILLTAVLFFKNTLFQIIPFNVIAISELWQHPFDFFIYWMPKLLPALVLSSFAFISRRFGWTWVIALLVDLWAVSNIVYHEASEFFLSINEILIASNLKGFEGSIITFLHPNLLLFPLSTLAYSIILYTIKPKRTKAQYKIFIIAISVSWLLAPYRYFYNNRSDNPYWTTGEKTSFFSTLNPFFFIKNYIAIRNDDSGQTINTGPLHYSIIAYAPMAIGDYIYWKINTHNFTPELNKSEKIKELIIPTNDTIKPTRNLYIILVESFESWTIGENQIEDQTITPNINKFLHTYNCLYAPNVVSQIRNGASGDGQMITITGLLPIRNGITCSKMPGNVYPSIAKHYNSATIVNPCPNTWNQFQMSKAYGFVRKRENITENDKDVFNELCRQTDSSDFCLAITISSHSPFIIGKQGPLQFSNDMPSTLHNYINSIHYADSCFGLFLNKFQSDSNLQNSIIVITGDHTVFNQQTNAHFQNYIKKHNQPIPSTKGFVPLIIYSPSFKSQRTITDTIYQMDIYPTLLQLTGQQNHTWRGFGVDITIDSLRQNRPFSPEEAYKLSDMIINSNYLKSYEKTL